MHKYQINKFRAIFENKAVEAKYFNSIREETYPEVKMSFIIGLGILWFYSIIDFFLLETNQIIALAQIKVLPTISTIFILHFIKKVNNRNFFYSGILLNLFIFIGIASYAFHIQMAKPIEMALTQFIFIVGLTLLIPNTFIFSMITGITSSLVFFLIDMSDPSSPYSNNVIIISTFLVYNIFIFQFLRKSEIIRRLKFRELIKEQKYIRVLNKEIAKRTELERQLREMACEDSLTHAYNRKFFIDIAEHEKRKSERHETPLSIILIDIDDFKIINDTYGHATGDRALKKFMKICKNTLRKSDIIGRMGGEEFAILCSESNKIQTWEIANRLCRNIHEQTRNLKYHFTISGGVAEIKPEHRSIDKALHMADMVLYEAKREGKNRIKMV